MLLDWPDGWLLLLPWCCCCCLTAELPLLPPPPPLVPPGSVALPFHVEAVLLPLTGVGGTRAAAAALVREIPIRWLGSCVSSRCT